MDKQKLQIRAYTEKVEEKLLAIASEEIADRDGDVISIDGWDLKNFKKNPVLMWLHMQDKRMLPIGRAKSISIKQVDGKRKLVFEPEFEEITEEGKIIKQFYEEGYLKAWSVGFVPNEWEKISNDGEFPPRYKFLKQELLEISAVPIPALPSATIISDAKSKGFNMKALKSLMKDMSEPVETEETEEVVEDTSSEVTENEEVKEEVTTNEEKDTQPEEVKSGRVLSTKNENKIKQAVTILQDVLSALEAVSEGDAKESDEKSVDSRLEKIEAQVKHLIGEVQAYRKENKTEVVEVKAQSDEEFIKSVTDIIEQATSIAVTKANKNKHSYLKGGE